MTAPSRLNPRDWLLLVAAATGIGLLACWLPGETSLARLATETSVREMSGSGNWLVATLDGLPWLDAPPLAHWLTVSLQSVVIGIRTSGALTIAALLAVALTVVLTARQGSLLMGRHGGLLAGIVSATLPGIVASVSDGTPVLWLAPAGALLFSLFDRVEAERRCRSRSSYLHPDRDFVFSQRGLDIAGLFVVTGTLSLLVPLGAVLVTLLPLAVFVALQPTRQQSRRYLWFWGWLALGAIASVWPLLVWNRIPAATEFWTRQFSAASLSKTGFLPALQSIVAMTLPWSLLIPFGLTATYHDAFGRRNSRELLIWCQATIVPLAVLLLQPGRPEFCLLAAPAWSLCAARGLISLRDRVTRLSIGIRSPRLVSGMPHAVAVGAAVAVLILNGESLTSGPDRALQVVNATSSSDAAARCVVTLPVSNDSAVLAIQSSENGNGATLVWTRSQHSASQPESIAVSEQPRRF